MLGKLKILCAASNHLAYKLAKFYKMLDVLVNVLMKFFAVELLTAKDVALDFN